MYNLVGQLQSECLIRPLTMLWLADTTQFLLNAHPFERFSPLNIKIKFSCRKIEIDGGF